MLLITTGDEPVTVDSDEWTDVLEVEGTTIINWLTVINEGDWPGFWRIVDRTTETPAARLPCGPGVAGERRAGFTIPCPGLSGARLQVKKGLMGGAVTGLFAFAGK